MADAAVGVPVRAAVDTAECADVAIVGAGPAGLCFARTLAATGLRIVLLERQPEAALAEPAFDGREIALTHRSVAMLREMGIWQRIPEEDISPLRDARIMNGLSRDELRVDHRATRRAALGYLAPNHLIRKYAYQAVRAEPGISLRAGVRVAAVDADDRRARLTLADGASLDARLLVAADSRFSETRRAIGIGARMHDFGKAMLVCRMAHPLEHGQAAWEWFGHGQTLAMLPLRGRCCSVVLTLPEREMHSIMAMDEADFGREMTRRLRGRLGAMTPIGTRHVYPLVGVYPDRFVARRFALIGDAAVGMHPVTAHGFNFGLLGQQTLAAEIAAAVRQGTDIAAPALLARYDRAHRRATLPLYLATRAIVGLFTDDRLPARAARDLVLRASARVAPFGRALARLLADDGAPTGVHSTQGDGTEMV
jgi:ubiquinone biosynthesis UbiH/UbiF/VisC/COQ6 family hydroxylase